MNYITRSMHSIIMHAYTVWILSTSFKFARNKHATTRRVLKTPPAVSFRRFADRSDIHTFINMAPAKTRYSSHRYSNDENLAIIDPSDCCVRNERCRVVKRRVRHRLASRSSAGQCSGSPSASILAVGCTEQRFQHK